jgi:hypothetical protein
MQKIATRIFIYSSIIFGVVGILVVLTSPGASEESSSLNTLLVKLMFILVFIILPSFALSVASKYLVDKN